MSSVNGSQQSLRVAVLGIRGQAARHIKLISDMSSIHLQHAYHPNKAKFESADYANMPITDDLNVCHESDVIIIASPTDTHFVQLEALVDYPGYILLEKPAVESRSDIGQLLNISDDRKSRIKINFNFNFNPVAHTLTKVLDSGALGKPIHASFETNHGGAFRDGWGNNWRTENPLGGSIYTVGIHYVQWVTERFGAPTEMTVRTSNYAGNSVDDTGNAQLIWDDGLMVNIWTSYASPLKAKFEITGTDGYVVYDGFSMKLYSPRDTFDEKGLFATPAATIQIEEKWNDAYQTSLGNSQKVFWNEVVAETYFDPDQFDSDVRVMGLLVDASNPKPA